MTSFSGRSYHGSIFSSPDQDTCLDLIQLHKLEQSFRDWANSAVRVDVRLSRLRILIIFLLIRYTGGKLSEVLILIRNWISILRIILFVSAVIEKKSGRLQNELFIYPRRMPGNSGDNSQICHPKKPLKTCSKLTRDLSGVNFMKGLRHVELPSSLAHRKYCANRVLLN
jgi:hypothetical protein